MSTISSASWYYLRNPFDNITKGNFKRMIMLARDTHDKLQGQSSNSVISILLQLLSPSFIAFNKAYIETQNNWALYQAETLRVENAFADLNRKSNRWGAIIQVIYDTDTAEYLSLFPNNKAPFKIGPYDLRLEALATLEKGLTAYPDLGLALAEVTAFRSQIEAIRTKQQGLEQQDAELRRSLELRRAELALALHRVLGGLIERFAENPAYIETFFELRYLQWPTPKINADNPTLSVQGNSRSKVIETTLNDNTIFSLANVGSVTLGFFVTNDENAATPNDMTMISEGETQTYSIADLTDGSEKPRFLMVVNMSQTPGRYRVSVDNGNDG